MAPSTCNVIHRLPPRKSLEEATDAECRGGPAAPPTSPQTHSRRRRCPPRCLLSLVSCGCHMSPTTNMSGSLAGHRALETPATHTVWRSSHGRQLLQNKHRGGKDRYAVQKALVIIVMVTGHCNGTNESMYIERGRGSRWAGHWILIEPDACRSIVFDHGVFRRLWRSAVGNVDMCNRR